MLVILERRPSSSPDPPDSAEGRHHLVAGVDHPGGILASIGVGSTCGREDRGTLDIRVDQWIDVNRMAVRVLGVGRSSGKRAAIEGAGVVCSHARVVIAAIFLDQLHPLDGKASVVEILENLSEGTYLNSGHHQLSVPDFPIVSPMAHGQNS